MGNGSRATLAAVQRRSLSRALYLVPFLVLALGLIATYLVVQTTEHQDEESDRRDFQAHVANQISSIERRVIRYEVALRGAAALVSYTDDVDSVEWAHYVSTLHMRQILPGVVSMG